LRSVTASCIINDRRNLGLESWYRPWIARRPFPGF
jgi:hypothetical protein